MPTVARQSADAEEKGAGFDPVREHRWFCPWVTAASRDTRASTHEKRSGWQQCVRALAAKYAADAGDTCALTGATDYEELLRKSTKMYKFLNKV